MIYEVRTYSIKPGGVAEFERRFGEALPHRTKYSPLGAFWHTEIGPLNEVIHVWPYEGAKGGVLRAVGEGLAEPPLELGHLAWFYGISSNFVDHVLPHRGG